MDAIVRAGCLYRVEMWGCGTWEAIERIQGRYVKIEMGVNSDTLDYIWRMETERNRMEVGRMERTGRYLTEPIKTDEERWP